MEHPKNLADSESARWECPACGIVLKQEYEECPKCGVFVKVFVKKQAEEKALKRDPWIVLSDEESRCFVMDEDRKYFYPWGFKHKGYLINTDANFEKLRKERKFWDFMLFVSIVGAMTAVSEFIDSDDSFLDFVLKWEYMIFIIFFGCVIFFRRRWVRRQVGRHGVCRSITSHDPPVRSNPVRTSGS